MWTSGADEELHATKLLPEEQLLATLARPGWGSHY